MDEGGRCTRRKRKPPKNTKPDPRKGTLSKTRKTVPFFWTGRGKEKDESWRRKERERESVRAKSRETERAQGGGGVEMERSGWGKLIGGAYLFFFCSHTGVK
jgi:hypothetical protein